MNSAINLDINASYGLSSGVQSALLSSGHSYLNPSSIHQGGQRARAVIEEARDRVRGALGLEPHGGVIFTSGATEANNLALFSPFLNYLSAGDRVSSITPSCVTTTIEHPSVLEAVRKLEEFGIKTTKVAPNQEGLFTPDQFADACDEYTKLVSVMSVNNETGQILDTKAISKSVKARFPNVLMHVDAVQALGKIEVSLDTLGADLVSISGHKIGALSGVGALACRKGIGIDAVVVGGPQELRRRAGTENVLGIYTLGVACDEVGKETSERAAKMKANREYIHSYLSENLPWLIFNAFSVPNVGNTLSVTVPGVQTSDLVVALDLRGVLVSSGSACASGKPQPSHVLRALGLSEEHAQQTIRISVKSDYEADALERACKNIVECIVSMKGEGV